MGVLEVRSRSGATGWDAISHTHYPNAPISVPNFPLVVDVVDEEDLEIKKVSVGDDAKGGGTK